MTPQQPHEFAALLIQKLEAVKRERESEEKLLRIVAEVIDFIVSNLNGRQLNNSFLITEGQ